MKKLLLSLLVAYVFSYIMPLCTLAADSSTREPAVIAPMGVAAWNAKYVFDENPNAQELATDAAGNAWYMPDYDDSSWGNIVGGIGKTGNGGNPEFTEWERVGGTYFLRRTFNVSIPIKENTSFIMMISHDDGAKVYINGELVYEDYGCANGKKVNLDKSYFKQGNNLMAIYVTDNGRGAQYIDCGIWESKIYTADNGLCYQLTPIGVAVSTVSDEYVYEEELWIDSAVEFDGDEYPVTVIEKIGNGVKKLHIPETVTSFGSAGNHSVSRPNDYLSDDIEEIFVNKDNDFFASYDGSLYNKDLTTLYFGANKSNVTVYNGTTTLSGCAFRKCEKIRSVSLPSTLKTISTSAFNHCSSLTAIFIPKSVTRIERWAFSNCWNLMSIIVEEGSDVYDSRDNCNAVIQKKNNELIAGCNSTVVPVSVTSLGINAFEGRNISTVTIPHNVKVIKDGTFAACHELTSVNIPNTVETIELWAFCGSGLRMITIPSSVRSIGDNAFGGCYDLQKVICLSKVPAEELGNAFPWEAVLYVPEESIDLYKSANRWKDFANILPIGGEEYYASFDNALYVEKTAARTNREATLSLKMKNNVPITSFQCDIVMPEGVSIAMEDDEFYMIDLSTERTTAQKTNTFDSALQTDGSVRVLCSSTRNYTFDGNDGEVATIKVNVADDVKGGDYFVLLKNVVMSDANGNTYKSDYVASVLTLSEYDLGDANNDFNVNIADYTTIANHILGRECEQYVAKAADVNCDNEVNVGDLSGLANLILYGTVTAPEIQTVNAAKSMFKVSTELDDQIYADATYINAGETKSLPVLMKNSVAMTGFQFDIDMPTGFAIAMNDEFYDISLSTKRTTARKTNTFDSALQTDGTVRVLCGSTNSYAFSGNDGEVALVTIKASDNVEPGDYTITLKNIVMSDEAGKAHKVADSKVTLTVASETTGISSASASKEMSDGKYVINNRLVIKNGNRTYNAHGELIR